LHTLGKLADADKLPVLLQFIMNAVDEHERSAATDAAINTYARTRNAQAVADSVLEALPKASVPIRCSFLQFLGKVGGAKALTEVRQNLEHADQRVQTAAIKALGLWPDAGPLQTLLGLAESRKVNEQRQIALRGYVTLVRTDSSSGARQQVTRLKAAMKVATRVEDKRMVLSALSEIPDPAALKFAESLHGDESIGEMAEQVSVAIARSICGSYWEESARAMKNIADASANSGLQAQARDIIQLIELTHPSKLPGASKAALLELTENALEGLDI